jgi:AraC family transcriptional regulator of adaptative response/methylated-DNA-[protein]-cysteine methyltransferase
MSKRGRTKQTGRFRTDEERWKAVARRDRRADDVFVYSVKTTGVYCRPSCSSRLANRQNVRYHATASDAEQAGFRPCKRCRPNGASLREQQASAVAEACQLIDDASKPLGLEALAKSVGMSPSHFHRVFKSLMGLTPKTYSNAQRASRMRSVLVNGKSITAAVYQAGFNSPGRFYATSKKSLGMPPSAFRAGGKGATIRFAVGECSLGSILVAASDFGICAITLGDDPNALARDLQDRFPHAEFIGADVKFEKWMAKVIGFVEKTSAGLDLPLEVQGTAFQHRVWQMLRNIPCGTTTTYAQIARRIGKPKAVRAVASAIAANPIAVAIPCHRVVCTDGSLSGYRWGVERKAALLKGERGETKA